MSQNVALLNEYNTLLKSYFIQSIMKIKANEDLSKWNIEIFHFDNIETKKLLRKYNCSCIEIEIDTNIEEYPKKPPKLTIIKPKLKSNKYFDMKFGTKYFQDWNSHKTIYEGLCFMHFYLEFNLYRHLILITQ